MDQRFKQFSGLVDDCDLKRGAKETTTNDLAGFWDMVYFQVEDVIAKFDKLEKLKEGNWVEERSSATNPGPKSVVIPARSSSVAKRRAIPVPRSKVA